jgi:fructokinase
VVAVAGEALVDFVPAGRPGLFEAAPGGSAANVAVGLARLQVLVRLLARIADDLLGHRVRTHLAGNGVDLSFAVRAAEPTSLARRVQKPRHAACRCCSWSRPPRRSRRSTRR